MVLVDPIRFPKIRDALLGAPILLIVVYWGLCWGPLFRKIIKKSATNVDP